MPALPCPCGSGKTYDTCCGPAHRHDRPPASAEALMRSRYSAYTMGLADYLLATWHASTRPQALDLTEEPRPRWIGLTIRRHRTIGSDQAEVEFIARYRIQGRAHRLHEISRFVRVDERWWYVDGDLDPPG